MKSDVITWRVDPALRRDLDRAAHARGMSRSALIEEAVRALLGESPDDVDAIRARASAAIGSLSLDVPYSKEAVRQAVIRRANRGR